MAYNAAGSQVGFTDVVENKWLMGTQSQPEWLVFDLVNGRQYKFSGEGLSNDGSSVKHGGVHHAVALERRHLPPGARR